MGVDRRLVKKVRQMSAGRSTERECGSREMCQGGADVAALLKLHLEGELFALRRVALLPRERRV